jgi:sugar lactone lactonase YvrE
MRNPLITGTARGNRIAGIRDYDDARDLNISIDQGYSAYNTPVLGWNPSLTNTRDWTFGKDGEKLYITYSYRYIREYDLSTRYDISTVSYTGHYIDVYNFESSVYTVEISPDGLHIFFSGGIRDTVHQHTLDTPYDLSSWHPSTWTSQLTNLHDDIDGSGSDSSRLGFEFNNDGTKLYIIGYGQDEIHQFSVSTAYSLNRSDLSYDGEFDTPGMTAPTGVRWKPDGTKFYVSGFNTDDIKEFSVSTPFDITSTVTELNEFYVGSQETSPRDVAFNADGTQMFVFGSTGDDISEYELTTGYDTTTASYVRAVKVGSTSVSGGDFNNDGTQLTVPDSATDSLYIYSLTSAYDITTLSTPTVISMSESELAFSGTSDRRMGMASYFMRRVRYIKNGTELALLDSNTNTDKINAVPLKVSNDATTLVLGYVDTATVGATVPSGIRFSPDGLKIFVLDNSDDKIYQWSLDYPYTLSPNLSTYDGASTSISTGAADDAPTGFDFTPTGLGMYVLGNYTDNISYFTLSSKHDVTSTITLVDSIDVSYSMGGNPSPVSIKCGFSHEGTIRLWTTNLSAGVYIQDLQL